MRQHYYNQLQNKMSDLEGKIKNVSSKYAELKKCQSMVDKQKLCDQIINMCVAVEKELWKQNPKQQIFKWTRQITDIKTKVINISQRMEKEKLNKKKSEGSSGDQKTDIIEVKNTNDGANLTQSQVSKKIVRTILEQELTAKQMKVSAEELQKLAIKMEQNLAVMEEIKNIIQDQGSNLEIIEDNIIKAYDKTQETNKELEEASQVRLRRRLMKIRLGVSGILGTIGLAIMGIPGAILGLVGGFKLSKFSKNSN